MAANSTSPQLASRSLACLIPIPCSPHPAAHAAVPVRAKCADLAAKCADLPAMLTCKRAPHQAIASAARTESAAVSIDGVSALLQQTPAPGSDDLRMLACLLLLSPGACLELSNHLSNLARHHSIILSVGSRAGHAPLLLLCFCSMDHLSTLVLSPRSAWSGLPALLRWCILLGEAGWHEHKRRREH